MNTEILKKLGVPSFAIALIVSVYLVGTTPVADGLPLAQYWHKHFVDALRAVSPMEIALDKKGDIQEIVYGYEYSLDKHINKLDDIKVRFQDSPSDLMIEIERWKAEKNKIENKLQDWRNKAKDTRLEIEVMIATTI